MATIKYRFPTGYLSTKTVIKMTKMVKCTKREGHKKDNLFVVPLNVIRIQHFEIPR